MCPNTYGTKMENSRCYQPHKHQILIVFIAKYETIYMHIYFLDNHNVLLKYYKWRNFHNYKAL